VAGTLARTPKTPGKTGVFEANRACHFPKKVARTGTLPAPAQGTVLPLGRRGGCLAPHSPLRGSGAEERGARHGQVRRWTSVRAWPTADQTIRSRFLKDGQDIRAGEEWPDRLRGEVEAGDLLLAVIGEKWLTAHDEHRRRRIDDRENGVRKEKAAELLATTIPPPAPCAQGEEKSVAAQRGPVRIAGVIHFRIRW